MKFPLLFLSLAISACGFSGHSAEELTKSFLSAIKTQQWQDAKNLLGSDCGAEFDSIVASGKAHSAEEYNVIDSKKTSEGFIVNTLVGLHRREMRFLVKKENGAWKIDCLQAHLEGETGVIGSLLPEYFTPPPPPPLPNQEDIAEKFLNALSENNMDTVRFYTSEKYLSAIDKYAAVQGKLNFKPTFITGSRVQDSLADVLYIFKGDTNTHILNLIYKAPEWKVLATQKTFSGQDKSILPDYGQLEYKWTGSWVCPNGCVRAGHPSTNCPGCGSALQKELIGHLRK